MADSVLMTFEHIAFGGANWAFGIESTAVQRGFDAAILQRVEFEERISSYRLEASRGSCDAFLFESNWGAYQGPFIGASASRGRPSQNPDLRSAGLNDRVSAIMLVGLPDGHEDRRFSMQTTAVSALTAMLSAEPTVVFEPTGGGALNRETWEFQQPTVSWDGFSRHGASALGGDRTFARIRIPIGVSVQLVDVVEAYPCAIYLWLSAEVVASKLVIRIAYDEVSAGEGSRDGQRRGSVEKGLGIYLGWNRSRLESTISTALTTPLADVLAEFQTLGQTLTPTAAVFLPGTILGSSDGVMGDVATDATLAVQGRLD